MTNNFDHIRSHRVQPHDRTWRSVKDKLARRKASQRVAFYRNLSIAAGIIAILAIVFGLSSQLSTFSNDVYSSYDSQPESIEDLPFIENDPFYVYDKILKIEHLYNISEPSNGGALRVRD